MFHKENISSMGLLCLGSLISLLLRFKHGDMSFDRLPKPSGPYEVGFKKFSLKTGNCNCTNFFYPVDPGTVAGNNDPVKCV